MERFAEPPAKRTAAAAWVPVPLRRVAQLSASQRALLLALGAVALVVVPPLLPRYFIHLLILSLVYAFLALAVDFLVSMAGLTSFGQAAIFGSAAYTVAVLTTKFASPFPVAAAAGLAVAVVVTLCFGLLVSHLRGDQFLLATLALGMVVWGGAYRWVSMTGGDNGLPGVPRPELFGFRFQSQPSMYYLVLATFVLATVVVQIVRRSPFGHSLLGVRENEARLRMLGYNVWLHKYLAFFLSGCVAGVGGVLYASYNGFVSPVDVHLSTSVQAVLMVILGGVGTLLGPSVGALLVVVIRDLLSAYTERWTLVLGVLYVLIMLYAPGGLLGLLGRRRAGSGGS